MFSEWQKESENSNQEQLDHAAVYSSLVYDILKRESSKIYEENDSKRGEKSEMEQSFGPIFLFPNAMQVVYRDHNIKKEKQVVVPFSK